MANLYRSNALALGYLGFDEASLKDFKTALQYAKKIDDPDIKNYTLSNCYLQTTMYFFNKRYENKSFKDSVISYHHKSLAVAKLVKEGKKEITTKNKYAIISFNHIRLGIAYLEAAEKPGSIENAEKHLLYSLDIVNKHNLIEADKVVLLNQLSWLYLEKKDFKKTIEYANEALELQKTFPDPGYRVESLEFLASAYTEIGDREKAKYYMTQYTDLKDSIRIVEKNNADQVFNNLLTDSKKTEEKKSSLQLIIISAVSLLLFVFITLYWKRKNKILTKKYNELISRIGNEAGSSKSGVQKKLKTSDETLNDLLKKLEKFEQSEHYLNKKITLSWLASHLDINANYLSESIKMYKNKSFTLYIDGLKINHILKKLLSDPEYREYTLDALAEKSGYDSKKDFAASFKAETKISPTYFIRNIKKENYFVEDVG